MAARRPTPAEDHLSGLYVRVLDLVSRCAQAVEEGNTHYLWDKSGELRNAAEGLHRWLGVLGGEPQVRAEVVSAAVRRDGRHYRAGRLLHPTRVELTATEVGSIMLAVAGSGGLATDSAALQAIARDAATIAARTDVRPDQVARVLCALRRWELRDAG